MTLKFSLKLILLAKSKGGVRLWQLNCPLSYYKSFVSCFDETYWDLYFICEKVANHTLVTNYILANDQLAGIFIKAPSKTPFPQIRLKLGVHGHSLLLLTGRNKAYTWRYDSSLSDVSASHSPYSHASTSLSISNFFFFFIIVCYTMLVMLSVLSCLFRFISSVNLGCLL